MKHFKILFLTGVVMLILAVNLSAQGPDTLWTRTYGGEHDDCCYSVIENSNGEYILAGWTRSFGAGGKDVYLLKIDVNGDTVWTMTYGGINDDEGRYVQETSDSGYIIAGCTMLYGEGWDVYLIRTYADGDTIWTKTYGGANWDVGYSVQETSDGGYIVAGLTESFGARGFDIYLLKVDSLGNTLWTRTHGDVGWDEGYSVQQISDGGYILVGAIESLSTGDFDIYFSRTYPNGYVLWTEIYGGDEHDVGYSVKETSDGGYIIAGKTKSFGSGLYDVYLIKTEPDLGIEEEKKDHRPKTTDIRFFCYPNPFTTEVSIKCSGISERQKVTIEIYNVSGRLVKDISLPTAYSPGLAPRSGAGLLPTVITWDGRDNRGERVSGGVYFLKFEVGEYKTINKVLMIR